MPADSLIPDRQLTFSPELAATIGLEPAILLQQLGNRLAGRGGHWHTLTTAGLSRELPFWTAARIGELLDQLAGLGVLSVVPGEEPGSVRLSFSASDQGGRHAEPAGPWQPADAVLELLALNHGIERAFAIGCLRTFTPGEDHHTRDSRFRQHVLAAWRAQQRQHAAFDIPERQAFDGDWQPSADAMDIMIRAGIDTDFIETLRPEFILYWRERGGPPREVNSRFVAFARDRWARFSTSLVHSTEPRRIDSDWEPGRDVYDILGLAGIDEAFARALLPEFVLYWRDSNEVHSSWNSKFLQHVKHQWRWQQGQEGNDGRQQTGGGSSAVGRTRDRSLADDLSDTSWAE